MRHTTVRSSGFAFALAAVLAAFTGAPHTAHAITGTNPCRGPFSRPTQTFPSVCVLLPQVCNSPSDIPISVLVDGLIRLHHTTRAMVADTLSPRVARAQIINSVLADFYRLGMPTALRNSAVNQINTLCVQRFPAVRAGTLSVGEFIRLISVVYLGASRQGGAAQPYLEPGDTVTTTTTGGIEINIGVIKINVSQQVTTSETIPENNQQNNENADYTEECDGSGNCVCLDDPA
jgi:hypothetical protein